MLRTTSLTISRKASLFMIAPNACARKGEYGRIWEEEEGNAAPNSHNTPRNF